MGFDIKCIIDILLCPAHYFCPFCRTLVYPNEALQTQCTHIYCKPCLSHVANGSRACPFDGNLVTESEAKPLVESDKVLAEKMGKIKVRCLFVKSGCTWEGSFAECNAHCARCSFGNTPIVCYWCGLLHLHKQASEHDLYCPGGYVAQKYGQVPPLQSYVLPPPPPLSQTNGSTMLEDNVEKGSYCAKSSEVGRKANKIHGKESFMLNNPDFMNHKGLEILDAGSSKVVLGGMSSADFHKKSLIYASKYGNGGSSGTATLRDYYDKGLHRQSYKYEPSFGSRDQKRKISDREHIDPYSVDATRRTPYHSLGYNVNSPLGQNSDATSRPGFSVSNSHSRFSPPNGGDHMGSFGTGPEVSSHHTHFGPDREYIGNSEHGFGEGFRSFNQSSDPFHDDRFPPSSDHLQRDSITGPRSINDHMGPSTFNNRNMRGTFGSSRPGHLSREGSAGPDALSGHDHMTELPTGSFHGMRNNYTAPGLPNASRHPESLGLSRRPTSTGWCRICQVDCETIEELEIHSQSHKYLWREGSAGPDALSGHDHMTELPTGSFHGMRGNYTAQGLPNASKCPQSLSLSRRPTSTGWCRICQVDCETIEELEIHSQTREHQNMAMDIVKTIKNQNKKHRASMGHFSWKG